MSAAPSAPLVVPLRADLREWAARVLTERWGGTLVVSRGVAHDAALLPGFVAVRGDVPVGLATYRLAEGECELLTLDSMESGRGVGTALIAAVREAARDAGCRRVWLITTNDNLEALRFYQRRGFVLVAVHREALVAARRLKPQIPLVGNHGIPLRDELELELWLVGAAGHRD